MHSKTSNSKIKCEKNEIGKFFLSNVLKSLVFLIAQGDLAIEQEIVNKLANFNNFWINIFVKTKSNNAKNSFKKIVP